MFEKILQKLFKFFLFYKMEKRMFDVVEPKKERTSKKLNLGNCKENSGDEIFRILSEMSKQRREIIDSMPQKKFFMSQKRN